MIDRISIVSRLTQVLYPDGVPADRVAHLPHHLALLDVVAESVATGKAPSVPLSLMAGELCPFGPVGGSELDQPIPFVVEVAAPEPAPEPAPETPPAPAAAAVVEVAAKTAAPAPKKGAQLRKVRVDWEKETRLGKMTDSALARDLGVTSNAVRQARIARKIPYTADSFAYKFGSKGIDWDNESRLGKVSDGVLAAEYGVNPSAVHQARQARGIPSATPKPRAPTPPAVTPERQAELDKIGAAVREGKVTRITPEQAKADLEAKYRAEGVRYGYKSRAQKKGAGVAS